MKGVPAFVVARSTHRNHHPVIQGPHAQKYILNLEYVLKVLCIDAEEPSLHTSHINTHLLQIRNTSILNGNILRLSRDFMMKKDKNPISR